MKTYLKMIGDGDSRIGDDNAVDLEPKGPKKRCQLVLHWMSSTSNQNPRHQ